MMSTLKKLGAFIGLMFLLLTTTISIVNAADFGPRRRAGERTRVSVAEPTAIVLLGAGLVSLGFYAKKKLSKKR